VALVWGFIVAMLSGIFENGSEGGMVGAKVFGYPWVWRSNIVQSYTESLIRFDNLAADVAFWSISLFIELLIVERFMLKRPNSLLNDKHFVFSAILLIPMGFLIGLIHELGHFFVGTAFGGTLTYFQVGFLELYPELTIASQFRLGSVIVTGLSSPFQHGLLLLAGSATVSIAALIIGALIYTKKLGNRTRPYLTILGFLGLLDMPFYVVFPSLGLRHWILFGENWPEPLIGAQQLGIPNPIFCLVISITTFALVLLYSERARIAVIRIVVDLKMKIKSRR
jgi:hypothetical protein